MGITPGATSMKKHHAIALLVIANVIWGSSHAVGKRAVETFDPMVLAALRVVIGSVCFWGLRAVGIAPVERIPRHELTTLAAMGMLTVAGAQLLDYTGLTLTTATDSSLMIIGEVIFTTLLAWLWVRERLTRQRSVGLVLGIVGVVVLTLGGAPDSAYAPQRALGNVLVLAALFCESVFTVIGARYAQRYDALTILRWTYTGSLVVWVPLLVWTISQGLFPAASTAAWAAVVYTAVATSVVCYTLWFWVIRSAGASLGAMTLFVQPLVGSLIGIGMLGEPQSTGLYVGGALILLAMVLATYERDDALSTQ